MEKSIEVDSIRGRTISSEVKIKNYDEKNIVNPFSTIGPVTTIRDSEAHF